MSFALGSGFPFADAVSTVGYWGMLLRFADYSEEQRGQELVEAVRDNNDEIVELLLGSGPIPEESLSKAYSLATGRGFADIIALLGVPGSGMNG